MIYLLYKIKKGRDIVYKIEDFAMLAPMKYYNNEDTSNAKRQDMIDNKNGESKIY